MIKKEELENLENLKKEKNNLEKRITKLKSKKQEILIDGVRASSKEFPYVQHTCKIEGLDNSIAYRKRKNTIKKLYKMLQQKVRKIDKLILHIEYELNYIEDSEIREIIRLKYEEDLNWIQIMYKMEYNSEDTARKKLERFLMK